ncbi:MAG: CaiB/BaiF CoA-transferase family protein [Chloroflexota bacterium]
MENASKENNRGPLAGIKVVDLTRFQAGPTCTMILADMGAEVIKIEEPEGDQGRQNSVVDGFSLYFAAFNRNKKSVTLNLKTEEGKELLRRFVRWGDVLAENFRPGVMARLGFAYEDVCQINPGIIMVSSSGFGQTGPYAQRAALNGVATAMSGMSGAGVEGKPPSEGVGVAIADATAGFFGAMGTILALYHRKNTGEGQQVDVSLLESTLVLMAANFLRGGGNVKRRGPVSVNAPSGAFPTSDGRYVQIYGHHDSHFPRLCALAGRPEMAKDPRFGSRVARGQHRDELNDMVAQWTRTMTADALEAALEEVGLPYARYNEVEEVLKDPHIRAREMLVDVEHHGEGIFPLVGAYPKLSKTPGSIHSPAPLLGEHNEEVYCGLLGVSKKELATLQAQGVI